MGPSCFPFFTSLAIAGCGRFLVGFGSSFAFVGVLSLAMHWLPRRYFSLVAGLITTFCMIGLVYGEVQITELATSISLNAALLTMAGIGAILSCLIFLVVRDGAGGASVKAQPLPEFFSNVWRVLTSPQVWLIGLVGACLYTSLSVFGELWGKTYLEHAYHLSKIEAAKAVSALFLGWAVGAPLCGYLSDRSGRRVLPLMIGAALSLVCISLVLYCPNLSYTSLYILLFLYGVFSAAEIIVFVMAKENSGVELSGTVFAATNMIVALGGVIFQPLVGTLLDYFGGKRAMVSGEHLYTVADYQMALSILPLTLILILILGFFMKDKRSMK